MSEEISDNPIFASNVITRFSHSSEIDKILLDNLEMESKEGISYLIFPIIDQVPENKKGIVRIFIANTSEQIRTISVFYSIIGWFSDLNKIENKNSVEKISLNPGEVWFRDILFKSSIKQGKNYFQVHIFEDKNVLSSPYIEYAQIREILEVKQIERSNFLGMNSKAYINPEAINYWIYLSLFGKRRYKKESGVWMVFKLVGLLGGGTFVALSFIFQDLFPEAILPVSAIISILSFLSFFSNLDDKYVNKIRELRLTENPRKGSTELSRKMPEDVLQKFCFPDMNYGFSKEKNIVYWKEGANKLYEKIIPQVGRLLNLPVDIQPFTRALSSKVEEIKDKEELKKKIEQGIQLQHEEGIRFDEKIDTMSEDSEAVSTEVQAFITDSSVDPVVETIVSDTSMDPQIETIKTETTVEPKVDVIKTESSMDAKIKTIETKPKSLVSDVRGVAIGKKTDLETIPEPKKLPFKKEDKTKRSVKDQDEN